MSKRPVPPAPLPWTAPDADPHVVYAFKALAAGVANEGQQARCLDFIINRIAGTYDLPFRPGAAEGERATCFAAGKQFVGQQIVRLVNYDVSRLPKLEA